MFVPQFIRLAPLQWEELILQVEVDLPDHAEIVGAKSSLKSRIVISPFFFIPILVPCRS